jgi:excisionase family DNA binding protein
MANDELLTGKATQVVLKISQATMYRMMARGELKPLKLGRSLRFSSNAIQALIQDKLEGKAA